MVVVGRAVGSAGGLLDLEGLGRVDVVVLAEIVGDGKAAGVGTLVGLESAHQADQSLTRQLEATQAGMPQTAAVAELDPDLRPPQTR